ncbi:doublesex- and mab-3-related transcription factor 1Y-like [Centruroides vittatus]|uniref:doublesex- and mab-3-related transcription factor 1Y-like n=1 Tax=Centruroides vittatus TaxID=120091 RepID=UPI00350E9091
MGTKVNIGRVDRFLDERDEIESDNRESDDGSRAQAVLTASDDGSNRRVPKCGRCRNHGQRNAYKGHKRYCRYRSCQCCRCMILSEKKTILAKQVAVRRAQTQDQPAASEQPTPVLDTPESASTSRLTINPVLNVRPVDPAKSQQILDSLHSLVGMFRHPQESFTKITLFLYYTILKQCRFDVLAARGKIVEAEKHISIFFLRESSMAQTSFNASLSSIFRQSSPGTSHLCPSVGCLPPYYQYPPEMNSNSMGSSFQFVSNAYNCPSQIPEWSSDHTITTERDQTDSENSNLGLPGLIYGSVPVKYQPACSSTSSTLVAIDRSNNVLSLET